MTEKKAIRKTGKDRKEKQIETSAADRKKEERKREAPRKAEKLQKPEARRKQVTTGKREMAGKSEAPRNQKDACIYAKKCGGCDYQGIEYAKQLKEKQEFVQKNIGEFCKVRPIIGMEQPYHYRNKVHAVFDVVKGGKVNRGKNSAPTGAIISGVYKAGTHDVINIDSCLIEDEKSSAIIRDIRSLLRSFKIKTYDEDTGYGLLRHVLVRRGFHSGEIMVVLVLGSPILPSKNNFAKALRKLHPEITTIVVNVNDKRTSMVLGEKETTIYGKGFIEDTLCGCTFRISPKSFYQVNPVQTEVLYQKAIEYAGLTGKEKVVDAYCGIGTIGLIAASRAKEVISVELNRDAVRDAITNAKRNQITNVQFYNADAGTFMVEMAEDGAQVDVVFMDPPRAGSDEAFLSSVIKLAPKRVVYVSCNPETLARDLKYLTKHGYRAVECTPVDMFPWTKHVEAVTYLQKVKKDSQPI
jgi:23S rRNA (uracil1939-C5)-methyltransferase